jgi:uncharacterized membrane protein
MSWLRLQRLRLWWEGAFWVIPLLGVWAGYVLDMITEPIDEVLSLSESAALAVSPGSAVTLFAAIGGGMVTFTGFVFSVILLMVQFGSAQYSPRTVSYFLRARSTQWVLAIFLATIVFPFMSLIKVGSGQRQDYSPLASIALSILLLVVSLVAFLALIHHVSEKIRVDRLLTDLGRRARVGLGRRRESLDRLEIRTAGPTPARGPAIADGPDATLVPFAGPPGQVVSINVARLRRVAHRRGARIVMLVRVGDAVVEGSRLAAVQGPRGVPARTVSRCVLVDDELSLRHDPMYALRILTDVSLRALSPAVNDPTTAARSLDEVEGVLRVAAEVPLGETTLPAGPGSLVLQGPTWPDVVGLALHEVITFGADQPQVTRRLTAMLDDLAGEVPEDRRPTLEQQRRRLAERVATAVPEHDRAVALAPDLQGIGASRSTRNT